MEQRPHRYNIHRNDPLQDFAAAFRDQQTETIWRYFERGTKFKKILDLETRNNLAQQALYLQDLKLSFICMLIDHIDCNHRNRYGETVLDTAKIVYMNGKLSKKMLDRIEAHIHSKKTAELWHWGC